MTSSTENFCSKWKMRPITQIFLRNFIEILLKLNRHFIFFGIFILLHRLRFNLKKMKFYVLIFCLYSFVWGKLCFNQSGHMGTNVPPDSKKKLLILWRNYKYSTRVKLLWCSWYDLRVIRIRSYVRIPRTNSLLFSNSKIFFDLIWISQLPTLARPILSPY